MLKAFGDSFLSLVYPQECRVCGRLAESHDDGVVCKECWDATRIFTGKEMLCARCGALLGDKAAPLPVFCHRCDEQSYDAAHALGIYEKALAATIIRLKTEPRLPKRLVTLLENAPHNLSTYDLVIPIPLSPQRQIERGYNQAEVIARMVGRYTSLPVDAYTLARRRHTPTHRVGMDHKAREQTVKGAFAVERPKLIAGKNILLADDVLTSGATASACAGVLKKSGAARVAVFTLARAVRHQA